MTVVLWVFPVVPCVIDCTRLFYQLKYNYYCCLVHSYYAASALCDLLIFTRAYVGRVITVKKGLKTYHGVWFSILKSSLKNGSIWETLGKAQPALFSSKCSACKHSSCNWKQQLGMLQACWHVQNNSHVVALTALQHWHSVKKWWCRDCLAALQLACKAWPRPALPTWHATKHVIAAPSTYHSNPLEETLVTSSLQRFAWWLDGSTANKSCISPSLSFWLHGRWQGTLCCCCQEEHKSQAVLIHMQTPRLCASPCTI